MFYTTEPETYAVKAQVRAEESSKLTIKIGEEQLESEVSVTDSEFSEINLGEIEISDTGDLIISFRLVQDDWSGFVFGKVVLAKQ